jgi:DsbC/DsbD-like thiol-disulfide interchange protein
MAGLPRRILAAVACAGLAVASPLVAQRGVPAPHARVTLLAEGGTRTVPLTVGIRFTLDDGWHIYWRNAGGSGSPPSVTWAGSSGVKMGDILWPVPARIRTDAIVSYGYEGDVLLMVPVERPTDRAITLQAIVDYVICRDVCVKETATAALALPAGAALNLRSPESALFARARARLPKPAPADWTVTARLGKDTLTLRVAARTPPRTATFFPFVNGVIDDAADQRVESTPQALTLVIPKSPYFSEAPPAIEGLLVVDDGRAFTVAVTPPAFGGH